MGVCVDCKNGGVYGDWDFGHLEYRCRKLGNVIAYIDEPDNSPNIIELRRRAKEGCPYFNKKRWTADRRAKFIYMPILLLGSTGIGYVSISSMGLPGIAFIFLGFFGIMAIISSIEGNLGNY